MRKKLFIVILVAMAYMQGFCQVNQTDLEAKFNELAKTQVGLNEAVQINVSKVSLYDFITTLGLEHKLNLSIDASLEQTIANNFFNVKVKDVLLFLVKKHDLEVQFLGKIISFKKNEVKVEKYIPKKVNVSYTKGNDFLSLKLEKDTLYHVAKSITDLTGKNIVLSPKIRNNKVTSYILNRPFDQVVDMMAKSNGLKMTIDKNGFYLLDLEEKEIINPKPNRNNKSTSIAKKRKKPVINSEELIIENVDDRLLKVTANFASIGDVIYYAAKKSGQNYFLYSDIDEKLTTSFTMNSISFEEILGHVFTGTKYTYKKSDDYFLIGEKDMEGLRTSELIRMKNRTIETVLEAIPSKITQELELKEFVELNGIVASGHFSAVEELKNFIKQIDVRVPMIQIEVIMVQYEKSYEIQTGLQAGVSDTKVNSSLNNLFPTTDVTLNSNQVNELIGAFNGLGVFNLGKVTSNFYLNLRALENNSIISLESTPKISTLSGHEANFKIGATDYYFEQTNQLINTGSIGNDVLQSGTWKATEANLSMIITPHVSEDEEITLEIKVEKSAFGGRSGENAPPGKTTQQFESMIRVKNGEMILLGGLDEAEKTDAGTGTPFFSRIPVIKWFFSGKNKKKSKSKLHMFIKPTVFYR